MMLKLSIGSSFQDKLLGQYTRSGDTCNEGKGSQIKSEMTKIHQWLGLDSKQWMMQSEAGIASHDMQLKWLCWTNCPISSRSLHALLFVSAWFCKFLLHFCLAKVSIEGTSAVFVVKWPFHHKHAIWVSSLNMRVYFACKIVDQDKRWAPHTLIFTNH